VQMYICIFSSTLQGVAVLRCVSVLQCVAHEHQASALYRFTYTHLHKLLQYVAVLQCVAVLQRVAVLQCGAHEQRALSFCKCTYTHLHQCCSALQCCRVLQCVAVCCSVLHMSNETHLFRSIRHSYLPSVFV